MSEDVKKQMQQEMLKHIDLIEEKGPEYYTVLMENITKALRIKEDTLNKIYDAETMTALTGFIRSTNEHILTRSKGLVITKEEIDLFCKDARKNVDNDTMTIKDVMAIKILSPLISMVIASNQAKDQVFEILALLKQENKL